MKTEQRMAQNANVLANAVELSSQVIMRVAGNEVANTVNGELMARSALAAAIAARLQSTLKRKGASQ